MLSVKNKIYSTSKFDRKLRKLLRKAPASLVTQINEVLDILVTFPYSPTLNTHKIIISGFKFVYSSRVNGDIRIIWRFDNERVEIIYLLDIGGHSGGKSVY